MLMAASSSFDGLRLQAAIYDYHEQRSQDGIVVEAHHHTLHMNVVRLFEVHFDAAWHRAQPPDLRHRVLWYAKRRGWEITFIAAVVIALAVHVGVAQNVAGGVAATAVFPIAANIRESLLTLRRRQSLRNRLP
jgi:hypothetical protein